MGTKRKPIGQAVEVLKANLDTVARVYEWGGVMGYENPRLFSRHFLRHFRQRPEKVLIRVRLRSMVRQLRKNNKSFRKIAWEHSLPDEKALYSFISFHLNISPSLIKKLSSDDLQIILSEME